MTLGDVMQATAAFVQVQSAFNWLLDNYPRLAGWVASARRVGSLMASIDHLEAAGMPGASRAITRIEHEGPALRIQNLSVELDDGTVVVKDADILIQPGERILLIGELELERPPSHARLLVCGRGGRATSPFRTAPRWS